MAITIIRADSESAFSETFPLYDADGPAVHRLRALESAIIEETERSMARPPDWRVQMFRRWAGEVGEAISYLECRLGAG